MNKKGYTLIEVITSILILSIASLILVSSFITVIKFMGKSETLKNASNDMFAFAQGSQENDLKTSVREVTLKSNTYHISGIPVDGSIVEYTSKKSDDVVLRKHKQADNNLLRNTEEYKKMISYFQA